MTYMEKFGLLCGLFCIALSLILKWTGKDGND